MNNRIKTFREIQGLSQINLADILAISQKKMSQIENCIIEPSLGEISKLTSIFNCKFEELFISEEGENKMSKNALIKYVELAEHVDPNFTHLVYGDSNKRGTRLDNIVSIGSYVFFHTSIGRYEYITGYYEIEKILYKGKDDDDISNLVVDARGDDIIIIGNRKNSKILTLPVLFDKKLATELISLGIMPQRFSDSNSSELSIISNATREHRELSQFDTDLLLRKCNGRG